MRYISDMSLGSQDTDLKSLILDRVRSQPDTVWTPGDFVDLASRAAVDKTLQRLACIHRLPVNHSSVLRIRQSWQWPIAALKTSSAGSMRARATFKLRMRGASASSTRLTRMDAMSAPVMRIQYRICQQSYPASGCRGHTKSVALP